jgi:phosphatidyl-myo-inositol dimannoside synthase
VRIGMIATEFPPDVGGMQVMAFRIATYLAGANEVIVCTTDVPRATFSEFRVLTNLRGRTAADVAALQHVEADVDVWLAMNAGYAAIANKLSKPLTVYFHGNDFLNPWVVSTPLLLRLLSKIPLLGKTWYDQRRAHSQAQIGAGIMSTAKVLTNSFNTKALIHEHYPHCQTVCVCPPGVEERFFQNDLATDRDGSVLNLLTVCRLNKGSRRKNVAGVLKALASLRAKLNFTYSIVGDGDDLENLRSLSNRLGLSNQVIFLGRVSDRDLLRLYKCASLFVLPAQSSCLDVEGFGIVYLEANAAGVPVLCSAAGGARDAVIDGQTGIVLPSSEPDRIAEGILHFVQSRSTYNANRIRQFASNFKWEIRAREIERQLLSSLNSVAAKAMLGNHSIPKCEAAATN